MHVNKQFIHQGHNALLTFKSSEARDFLGTMSECQLLSRFQLHPLIMGVDGFSKALFRYAPVIGLITAFLLRQDIIQFDACTML